MTTAVPNIDYTSRDYDGLRASLLAYAAANFPQWQPGSEGDFGVLMVELLAYMGDVLSYYTDRAQNEAYLPTATQRASVLNISKLLGYKPGTGSPATGNVTLQAAQGSPAITVPAGTQLSTAYIDAVDGPIIFETNEVVTVPAPATDGTGGTLTNVAVTEGQTIQDTTNGGPLHVATATGYPAQSYRLPNPRIYQETVQVYVNGVLWDQVDHLLEALSTQNVYTVDLDADGYTWVSFGDGVNGVVPALGLDIGAVYRTGYGAAGNLAPGAITTVYTPVPGLSLAMLDSQTANYPNPTTGGADPEDNESIRANAPTAFNAHQRAVTAEDFASFALTVPGVAKAAAVAKFWTSVSLYILGPGGNPPTSTLLDRVTQTVQGRALAGVTVNVSGPNLVKINVGSTGSPVTCEIWPQFSRVAAQVNITRAIQDFLAFSNQDLGAKITVAELYSVMMAVEGVRYVSIPLLARDDSAQTGTADIQLQPLEFPVANNVVVTTTGGLEG